MCVKLLIGYLNPALTSHTLTNTYTYGVTIASRMCGGKKPKS